LADRTDRQTIMENQLQNQMGIPVSMIQRVDAIRNNTCGHLGCTDSHIKALSEHLLTIQNNNNGKPLIMLEDDFEFNYNKHRFIHSFKTTDQQLKNQWDVIMLTTVHHETRDTDIKGLKRIKWGTTTCGYIVHPNYITTLLTNFKESRQLLFNELEVFKKANPKTRKYETGNALDQYWFKLQAKDRFYIIEPHIGRQSYSTASSIMSNTD